MSLLNRCISRQPLNRVCCGKVTSGFMPSNPTSRLSVVALGTLAALVAQELARTASVSTSTTASIPESGTRDPSQPVGPSKAKLTKPIAQPETVSPQRLTTVTARRSPTTVQATNRTPSPGTASNEPANSVSSNSISTGNPSTRLSVTSVPNAGLLPIPPSPLVNRSRPLRSVDVNQLPVDKIVAASLGQSGRQLATTPTPHPELRWQPRLEPTR